MTLASTDIIDKVDEAFYWIGGISLFLLVGITLTMIYFTIRYSRKRNPKPADIHGNWKLEVTWIVIPTIIVLFMFWKGYEGFRLMRDVPEDAMEVEVVARQWSWTFNYPDSGISSTELYVPEDRAVKLLLTAPIDDVVHSFYLPDFRTKEDCVPGRENFMWFRADDPGTHNIFCAEFCGKDHAYMRTFLRVLTAEDYDRWVIEQVERKFRPVSVDDVMDPASEGIQGSDAAALYATYCASCHGKGGEGGLIEGARTFTSLTDWKNGPKITDMFRTLTDGLAGTQMRSFGNLSAWDRFALAYFVAGFYPGSDRPEATREEFEKLVADYKLDEQQAVRKPGEIDAAIDRILEEAGE